MRILNAAIASLPTNPITPEAATQTKLEGQRIGDESTAEIAMAILSGPKRGHSLTRNVRLPYAFLI